jgi:ABC-2 type transport system permease protein
LLISSLVEGEYTAPIVSFGIVIAIVVSLDGERYQAYSPWAFMVGTEFWDRQTMQLVGPVPWMQAAVYLALAALLSFLSVKAIQRREF